MSVFVQAQGIRTVHTGPGWGGLKRAKFCPRNFECSLIPKSFQSLSPVRPAEF